MTEQLKEIELKAKEELSHAADLKSLDDIRVRFLGKKKGPLSVSLPIRCAPTLSRQLPRRRTL